MVSPHFWTGHTGREIRKLGHEAQIIALYLMTAPGSNMIGLYYLPLPVLVHETGCPIEGASKGLIDLQNLGFCEYDQEEEVVWVCEMARWQIGDEIKEGDKRHGRVVKEVASYSSSPFYDAFMSRYAAPFRLPTLVPSKGHRRGIEGASKPHRSPPRAEQDQDIDKDQDQEQEQEHTTAPASARKEHAACQAKPKTGALPPDPLGAEGGRTLNSTGRGNGKARDPADEAACEAFGEALLAAWPAGHVNPVRYQRALLLVWQQGLIRADGTAPKAEKSRTAAQVLADMPLWQAYHDSGARPKHLETYLEQRCFQAAVPSPLKTNSGGGSGAQAATRKRWGSDLAPGTTLADVEAARAFDLEIFGPRETLDG